MSGRSEKRKTDELTPDELEAQIAEPLPERAAMSTVSVTGLDAASSTVEAVGDGVSSTVEATGETAPEPVAPEPVAADAPATEPTAAEPVAAGGPATEPTAAEPIA